MTAGEDAGGDPVSGAPMWPPPPPPPSSTPPPTRRRRRWPWVVLGVVVLVVVVAALAGSPDEDEATSSAPTTTAPARTTAAPTTTTTAAAYVPTPADFAITVVVLEKSCFGSAGCNVTYTIELAYLGPPLDPADTWQVVYDVTGGESVQTNTLEVTGTEYRFDEQSLTSTPSEGAELTAAATLVRAK